MKTTRYTTESVTQDHPDKLCGLIADAVLGEGNGDGLCIPQFCTQMQFPGRPGVWFRSLPYRALLGKCSGKERYCSIPGIPPGRYTINALSDFYMRLLGWKKSFEEEGYFLAIQPQGGGMQIAFQTNELYVPPVWPEEAGAQQQMLHLDFEVKDKEHMTVAVRHAVSCGATVAQTQFSDEWTVMIDPVGHPFCFVVWE